MSDHKKKTDKDALKALRAERKASIDRARERIKAQNRDIKAIRQAMGKKGGATVPEIARATRLATSTALAYVVTLKKYGTVLEGVKDGDYFKYELASE